ncbi:MULTISPECIES: hemerythrin domain-containing protein [Methylococcus]|uniref:Hemerythrin domain-containing protein n=1 Tax=Methylococcus capsulatus TaxID=414 RepID=A0ABZ2F0Q1_METCP|nr:MULTISPECIES: hemerythrin domain-containing protein [Methylococcus]MDF9391512.1 hemerythrin domain-containing protein [Methylococcus capsulatus]
MENRQSPPEHNLFEAFREDHTVLGRGFHELSQCLRGNDAAGARKAAERIDTAAGAHIAFEEKHFYPTLARMLGAPEVRRLYAEHGKGLAAVRALLERDPRALLPENERRRLLELSQSMETHIAECGEMFQALGRLSDAERAALYRQLTIWREKHPRWTALPASG